MSAKHSSPGLASPLERARDLLARRLFQLEDRLRQDDEAAWELYLATLNTLAAVANQATPGAHGEMLTTAQMAAKLGVAPKTLLKHKRAGVVKPALGRGKLLRWKGDEIIR